MALVLADGGGGLSGTHGVFLHLLLVVDEHFEDVWVPAGVEGSHVHDVADI